MCSGGDRFRDTRLVMAAPRGTGSSPAPWEASSPRVSGVALGMPPGEPNRFGRRLSKCALEGRPRGTYGISQPPPAFPNRRNVMAIACGPQTTGQKKLISIMRSCRARYWLGSDPSSWGRLGSRVAAPDADADRRGGSSLERVESAVALSASRRQFVIYERAIGRGWNKHFWKKIRSQLSFGI